MNYDEQELLNYLDSLTIEELDTLHKQVEASPPIRVDLTTGYDLLGKPYTFDYNDPTKEAAAMTEKLQLQAQLLREGLIKPPQTPSATSTPSPPKEMIAIDWLFDDLIYEKTTTNKDNNWKDPKTLNDNKRAIEVIKLLIKHFKPDAEYIHELDMKAFHSVHSALRYLPIHKNLSAIADVIPVIGNCVGSHFAPPWKTMKGATLCKYENPLKAVIKHGMSRGYIERDFLFGVTYSEGKRIKSEKAYATLEPDDLNALLSGHIYQNIAPITGRRNAYKEWPFWMIPIAMFTGARQAEIAQLYVADIKHDEDLSAWYFDINDSEYKEAKSVAAIRTVPVHPDLIKLGFIEFVKDKQAKSERFLFPELWRNSNGGQRAKVNSNEVNKWFNGDGFKVGYSAKSGTRDKEQEHLHEAKKKVFHSLRHTFIDTLRQSGVTDPQIAPLSGHEKNVGLVSHYGNKESLKVLLMTLSHLRYEGVSLDHISFETYQRRKPSTQSTPKRTVARRRPKREA